MYIILEIQGQKKENLFCIMAENVRNVQNIENNPGISFVLFGFFVKWHINRPGMPKPSLKNKWYYLTQSWRNKEVYTFPKSFSSKVNFISLLKFELAHYNKEVNTFL